jgi:hypothetical protein
VGASPSLYATAANTAPIRWLTASLYRPPPRLVL